MEKMLVAVFDSETKAFEGVSALKDLHNNGDITLYANAVVTVDANGKLNVQQTADEGPVGTATGLFIGSLFGLLGGPVGLAIGAGAGAIAGLTFDASNDSINTQFVDEVAGKLTKGKSAVIADIDETWTVPADTRLEELGGIVFRRFRYEVEDDQLRRGSEAIVAEYNEWQEEMKEGFDADQAKIRKSLANAKEKAQMTDQQIQHKLITLIPRLLRQPKCLQVVNQIILLLNSNRQAILTRPVQVDLYSIIQLRVWIILMVRLMLQFVLLPLARHLKLVSLELSVLQKIEPVISVPVTFP